MVLRPRKTSHVEEHINDGTRTILDGDDDKKKRRKKKKSGFSSLLYKDTKQLRFGVVVLLIANIYVYNKNKNAPIISCRDVISSFTSWRQHFMVPSPRHHYDDNFLFSTIGRSGRVPSITERTQYYMGPMWFHPELQGVPASSPFGPHWLERYRRAIDKNGNYQHQPVLIDTRNASRIYHCAKQNNDKACQAILFQSNNNLMDTVLPPQTRSVILNAMDASFLVQEWYSLSFISYWWNVLRYEGVVGFLYEVSLQCTTAFPHPLVPAYLWNLDLSHISMATTLWNSQTPVFGRFRNDSSIVHHSTILWPFIGDRPGKLPTVKNNHQEENKNHQQVVCWNPKKTTSINSVDRRDEFINIMDQVIAEANFKPVHVIQEEEQDVSSCHVFLVLDDRIPDPNLKWKLFHTILITPSIRYQSWIMEPFLQPYLHYVPLQEMHEENEITENDVYPNVLKQLLWIRANPTKSQKIAHHSTLWIYDLFFHPQSFHEEEVIMRTIIYRYQQFILRAKPIMPSVWVLFESQLLCLWRLVQNCLQWLAQDWLRVAILVVILLYYPFIHLF